MKFTNVHELLEQSAHKLCVPLQVIWRKTSRVKVVSNSTQPYVHNQANRILILISNFSSETDEILARGSPLNRHPSLMRWYLKADVECRARIYILEVAVLLAGVNVHLVVHRDRGQVFVRETIGRRHNQN